MWVQGSRIQLVHPKALRVWNGSTVIIGPAEPLDLRWMSQEYLLTSTEKFRLQDQTCNRFEFFKWLILSFKKFTQIASSTDMLVGCYSEPLLRPNQTFLFELVWFIYSAVELVHLFLVKLRPLPVVGSLEINLISLCFQLSYLLGSYLFSSVRRLFHISLDSEGSCLVDLCTELTGFNSL